MKEHLKWKFYTLQKTIETSDNEFCEDLKFIELIKISKFWKDQTKAAHNLVSSRSSVDLRNDLSIKFRSISNR